MKQVEAPPTGQIVAMIHGQLTTAKRWLYRILLVVTCALVALIGSLWLTEPGPLPVRLHIAFASFVTIGCGWICVFTWLLWRRSCHSVVDQLVTGWAATIATGSSLIVAMPIAISRGTTQAVVALLALGLLMFAASLWLLARAYRHQAQLRLRLSELRTSQD